MGLERLFDIIVECFEWFIPFVIVRQYERGVVLHFGVYNGREIGPGFHWIWPFGIDEARIDGVVTRTNVLNAVVVKTADDVSIQAGVMIRWRIKNIAKALLEVEEVDHAIRDISYGVIARAVSLANFEKVNTQEWINAVEHDIRQRGRRYGLEVEEAQVTDMSKAHVIRLINAA